MSAPKPGIVDRLRAIPNAGDAPGPLELRAGAPVDHFSLEHQAELAAAGLRPKRRRVGVLSDRYARALDELTRAEEKLARALRKWEKARAKTRRAERELARIAAEREPEAGS